MKKQLIKNKVYAMGLVILGIASVCVTMDVTFLIFCLVIGILMFVAKESWVM